MYAHWAISDPALPPAGLTLCWTVQVINAVLSVMQGVIGFTTSIVTHMLGFFWDIVAFVMHNIVVIGVIAGQ